MKMYLGTLLRPLENHLSQSRDRSVTSQPFKSVLEQMAIQGAKDVSFGAATVSEILDELGVAAAAEAFAPEEQGSSQRETP
jgi:hypothetical protein